MQKDKNTKSKNIQVKNVFDCEQTKIKSFNDLERTLLQEELICYTRCTHFIIII